VATVFREKMKRAIVRLVSVVAAATYGAVMHKARKERRHAWERGRR
jgi:hypothetical protein